jgi:hypothetical protein
MLDLKNSKLYHQFSRFRPRTHYQTLIHDRNGVYAENLSKDCPNDPTEPRQRIEYISFAILFGSFIVFLVSSFLFTRTQYQATDLVCSKRLSPYSKTFRLIKTEPGLHMHEGPAENIVQYHWVQTDSEVVPKDWLGIPTNDTEANWLRLIKCRSIFSHIRS